MNDKSKSIEEQFSVLDSVPVGACVLQNDFVVLFWNRCLEDWTQIPRSQILGTSILDRFPHLSQPKYASRLQQIFTGGPPTIFSSQIHKYLIPATWQKDEYRIQQATVTAVVAQDVAEEAIATCNGSSFYALLVIQDVTDLTHRIQDYRSMRDRALEEIEERLRVEEELRGSQHFIEQIADAAPYLMYIYDLIDRRNIYTNRQFSNLLGYTQQEIQEMDSVFLIGFVHPDDVILMRGHLQKLATLAEGEIIELEYRLKDASGEWRWIRSRDQVFARSPEGTLKQIFGTGQDITEYKRAEVALRQQTERERLMVAIATHIRQSLDLQEVLTTAVNEIQHFLQADRVLIVRLNPCQGEICTSPFKGTVTVEALATDCQSMWGTTLDGSCFEEIYVLPYQPGQIRASADIYAADLPQYQIDWLEKFSVRAYLGVPLLQGDNLWGLLMAHQCHSPREWMPLEIELLSSLATQLAIAIQQAEIYQQLQVANQKLEHLATSDELTQVANRRRFDECLQKEWQRHAREGESLSLILCDVDFFKLFNDTYGHQAGDRCLRQVAQAIRQTVKRSSDLVARYGGEEFAIILPNTQLPGALQVAEEVRQNVAAQQIPHVASRVSPYVTVSLGVTSVIPTAEFTLADLIDEADRALYQAKGLGRDRVFCDSEGMSDNPQPTITARGSVGFPRKNQPSPTSAQFSV